MLRDRPNSLICVICIFYTHLAVAHADPLIEPELVGDHGLVLVVARRVLVPLEQLLAPVGEGLDDALVLHRCVAELRLMKASVEGLVTSGRNISVKKAAPIW